MPVEEVRGGRGDSRRGAEQEIEREGLETNQKSSNGTVQSARETDPMSVLGAMTSVPLEDVVLGVGACIGVVGLVTYAIVRRGRGAS